jgi:hypothetical protein
VWEIVTELLDQAAVAAIFYGAVLILGAFLAGPTRLATGIRRVTAPYMREPVERSDSCELLPPRMRLSIRVYVA